MMIQDGKGEKQEHQDFFISYTRSDEQWAVWIAWQLKQEGYSVKLQAWDFLPGDNFMRLMDEAIKTTKRTLAVLSPEYLDPKAVYPNLEMSATLVQDPTGQKRKLLPVRVRECTPTGLLAVNIYVDLVNLDKDAAKETLLAGVQQSRHLPLTEPLFPGKTPESRHLPLTEPLFPGKTPAIRPPRPDFAGTLNNIPYQRNKFFQEPGELLARLYSQLQEVRVMALHGLGGIGKTQLALEYAYRHLEEYEAVLWVPADSQDTLFSSFVNLANLLKLPRQKRA